MGQGMTKQQKQIQTTTLSANGANHQLQSKAANARNSACIPRLLNSSNRSVAHQNSQLRQSHAVLMTVNCVDQLATDQTFSSTSARQQHSSTLQALTQQQPERLSLKQDRFSRESSCNGNSGTHAEGKHAITVNRTKTPKLGIHMKTATSSGFALKKNLVSPMNKCN